VQRRRRIVILRFFVAGAFASNREKPRDDALSGDPPLGTKAVFGSRAISRGAMMSGSREQNRITPVDPDHATGRTRQLFDHVRAKFGVVPNLFRVLGQAPAALEAYVNFSAALSGGTLDAKVQELIGLTVAESNLCDYCLNAHIFMGGRIGLAQAEIADAIRASAADGRTDAILKLARSIIVQRAEVTDADLQRARAAGLTDCEIVETVANVLLNIFMNYLDYVARPAVDFPQVGQYGLKEPVSKSD
jgi:uncharacterized peroxidase-related enzyme